MTNTTDIHVEAPTAPSLYERIGGRAALERVVPDVLQNHIANPLISHRYQNLTKPLDELIHHSVEFFATGLSGEPTYTGLPMPKVHAGMNIDEAEYMAVLDDILAALDKEGIGPQEQAELLYILYGMKSDIIGK